GCDVSELRGNAPYRFPPVRERDRDNDPDSKVAAGPAPEGIPGGPGRTIARPGSAARGPGQRHPRCGCARSVARVCPVVLLRVHPERVRPSGATPQTRYLRWTPGCGPWPETPAVHRRECPPRVVPTKSRAPPGSAWGTSGRD